MTWEKLVVLEVPPLTYIPFLKGMLTVYDDFVVIFKNRICEYYNKEDLKIQESRKLAEKIRQDGKFIDKYWQWVNDISKMAWRFADEKQRIDFTQKTDSEIWQYFEEMFELIKELGSTVTYARFEPANMLRRYLTEKGLSNVDANRVLMNIIQPTTKSIASKERKSFSKKVSLVRKNPSLVKKLAYEHCCEWNWVGLDWGFGKVISHEDFQKELIDAANACSEQDLSTKSVKYAEEKENLKRKYLEEPYMQNLARMIEIEGFYRLERRYIISKLLYSMLGAFKEIERKKGMLYNNILLMTPDELQQVLIEGASINLSERTEYSVFHGHAKELRVIDGTIALDFAKEIGIIEETIVGDVIEGTTASVGLPDQKIIQGLAVIVKNKEDFSKIKEGTILVASETTPDYIPLFKMVKAIITEHGGITSHAAIVSREMGVPCIVAAKGLLSMVKDGDAIQLDIEEGKIKKITSLQFPREPRGD